MSALTDRWLRGDGVSRPRALVDFAAKMAALFSQEPSREIWHLAREAFRAVEDSSQFRRLRRENQLGVARAVWILLSGLPVEVRPTPVTHPAFAAFWEEFAAPSEEEINRAHSICYGPGTDREKRMVWAGKASTVFEAREALKKERDEERTQSENECCTCFYFRSADKMICHTDPLNPSFRVYQCQPCVDAAYALFHPTENLPTPKPDAHAPKVTRASRLPPHWFAGDEDVAFALKAGMTRGEIAATEDRFRDYWLAKAGSGALKVDWRATWRLWVRRTLEDPPKVRRGPPLSMSMVKPSVAAAIGAWNEMARRHERVSEVEPRPGADLVERIEAIVKEIQLEGWRTAIGEIELSPYLIRGGDHVNLTVGILANPVTCQKVLAGFYRGRATPPPSLASEAPRS